jgi:hypothetical protein
MGQAYFLDSKYFSNYSNYLKFVKYKSYTSFSPKISKFCKMVIWIIVNNFPFARKFKFQVEFELKFQEAS